MQSPGGKNSRHVNIETGCQSNRGKEAPSPHTAALQNSPEGSGRRWRREEKGGSGRNRWRFTWMNNMPSKMCTLFRLKMISSRPQSNRNGSFLHKAAFRSGCGSDPAKRRRLSPAKAGGLLGMYYKVRSTEEHTWHFSNRGPCSFF